jgi:hypothetical protein
LDTNIVCFFFSSISLVPGKSFADMTDAEIVDDSKRMAGNIMEQLFLKRLY